MTETIPEHAGALYTSYDQLPLTLSAPQAAKVIGISVSKMYQLMHRSDFPTLFLDKRMLVTKDALLRYLDEHTRTVTTSSSSNPYP